MHLARPRRITPHLHKSLPALLRLEEGPIPLHQRRHGGRHGKVQLLHPERHQIRAKFLTRELHRQEPVRLRPRLGARVIDQIAALPILCQETLRREIIPPREHQELHAGERELFQLLGEFPRAVIPEDDTPLVEIRQRQSEAARQLLADPLHIPSRHSAPPYLIFANTSWNFS